MIIGRSDSLRPATIERSSGLEDPDLRGGDGTPRVTMALKAACLPGRLLLLLVCALQALFAADYGHFATYLQELQVRRPLRSGRA